LSVIGKSAPAEWKIEKWYQGESDVDLGSGKTTLLVFWEEWCPHCKREVPKLQDMYNDLKGQGLQVVGLTKITRSSSDEKVSAFIADKHIAYPIAKEDGTLSSYFNVSGIPAAAVLKDGKVVWRGHPAQLDEAKLKDWL
jgi:thiol-disulfide isomerase/thioredoxin